MSFQKNQPKVIKAWAMYDWANSAFALVITAAVFPAFYSHIIKATNNDSDLVTFLGMSLKSNVILESSLSFSFLVIALLSPLLTAIADYSGKKKMFMQFFCVLGALGCASLSFFGGVDTLWIGIMGYVLGMIGFAGSIVFNNSYLPDIVTEDRFDQVSARGFVMGYIGSLILLIFSLVLIMNSAVVGLTPDEATQVVFFITAIWWVGFAQYSFKYMPTNVYQKKPGQGSWVSKGFEELGKVWKELKTRPLLKTFLSSYFFYNMGVQTVIYIAALFADEELHLATELLIGTVLIMQLVAILGAWLFSKMSKKMGNIRPLMIAIVVWILICVMAYFTYSTEMFLGVAALVGLVMGGVQSLSRSTYAKLIPEDTTDTASFFSFYDVCEKVSVVLGTLVYAIVHQISSMRMSVLTLILFFVIGLFLLSRIPSKQIYED